MMQHKIDNSLDIYSHPLQLDPLAINIYDEVSLQYYHHFAHNNPGIFIDYTGLMIQFVNLLHTYEMMLTCLLHCIVMFSNSYGRNPWNLMRK